ncbi:unnamed protein product [Thlaspi arvense]|uniref:RNase H type-1 domain-containing protein n=1 Tax=Thlaspi arvense TaxID=13288 RepID=A0AAU9TA73_THLAR|nr:unnamed protein product [Thlaspi arvense]
MECRTAGLGWIFEGEHLSRQIQCSDIYPFVRSPLMAEALAIRSAMEDTLKRGFTKLKLESDSMQMIKTLTTATEFSELYGIVGDIRSITSNFKIISFRFISRETNMTADMLTKRVLAQCITNLL